MAMTENDSILYKEYQGENRLVTIDFVKAIAILLVIWGHMIQYLHGSNYDYWSNYVFKWIYGFHMPLFALVSGFLFSKSRKTSVGVGIARKAKQLLLPVISWAFVLTILDCVINALTHEENGGSFIVNRFITRCINDLWFLKGIFICFLLVSLIETITKRSATRTILVVAICLSTLLWPTSYGIHLYGFLVPYYFIGYAFGVHIDELMNKEKLIHGKGGYIATAVLFILYIALLTLFKKQHYIYTSGLSIIGSVYGVWGQIGNDLFRLITGIIGCSFLISFCWMFQSRVSRKLKERIIQISSSTLAIYAITASAFVYLPQVLVRLHFEDVQLQNPFCYLDLLVLFPLSILLMIICMWVAKCVSGKKIALFLFGK